MRQIIDCLPQRVTQCGDTYTTELLLWLVWYGIPSALCLALLSTTCLLHRHTHTTAHCTSIDSICKALCQRQSRQGGDGVCWWEVGHQQHLLVLCLQVLQVAVPVYDHAGTKAVDVPLVLLGKLLPA